MTIFRSISLSILVSSSLFSLHALADPLQGHIEEKGKSTRLKQSADEQANQLLQGEASQLEHGRKSEVKKKSQRRPLRSSTDAGQDELLVDWQGWSDRIGQRIWSMLEGQYMTGSAEIQYTITNDGRIILLSASGSHETVQKLLHMVMSLQGDPVLQFPAGTQRTEHTRITAVQAGWQKAAERQYWAPEHIIRQW